VATGVGLLACLPFALLVASQGEQVSWLTTYPVTITDVTMGVFWGTESVSQWVGTAILVLALAVVARSWWSGRYRGELGFVVGWLLLPLGILLALHPVIPLYHRRYLLATIPALALVLGFLVARLRWVWLRCILMIVLILGCVPGYLDSREPLSKLTPAPAIKELAKHARAGDGIYVVESDENGLAWSFPVPIGAMVDLSTPLDDGWRAHQLYSDSVPVDSLGDRLTAIDRVWVWSDVGRLDETEAAFALQDFAEVDRIKAKDHYRTVLVLMERVA
jgi:mannosyltransferase